MGFSSDPAPPASPCSALRVACSAGCSIDIVTNHILSEPVSLSGTTLTKGWLCSLCWLQLAVFCKDYAIVQSSVAGRPFPALHATFDHVKRFCEVDEAHSDWFLAFAFSIGCSKMILRFVIWSRVWCTSIWAEPSLFLPILQVWSASSLACDTILANIILSNVTSLLNLGLIYY